MSHPWSITSFLDSYDYNTGWLLGISDLALFNLLLLFFSILKCKSSDSKTPTSCGRIDLLWTRCSKILALKIFLLGLHLSMPLSLKSVQSWNLPQLASNMSFPGGALLWLYLYKMLALSQGENCIWFLVKFDLLSSGSISFHY